MPGRILNNIINFPSKFAGWFLPRKQLSNENLIRDVFLGGTCGTSTWRDLVVIPKLKYATIVRCIETVDGFNISW